MKPKNFPGRKHARLLRIASKASTHKGARSIAHPTVKDTCWRLGAASRDPNTGIAR